MNKKTKIVVKTPGSRNVMSADGGVTISLLLGKDVRLNGKLQGQNKNFLSCLSGPPDLQALMILTFLHQKPEIRAEFEKYYEQAKEPQDAKTINLQKKEEKND